MPTLPKAHARPGPSHLMGWAEPGSSRHVEDNSGSSSPQQLQPARPTPSVSSLQLCIKSGRFAQTVWRVYCRSLASDGALFQSIKETYVSACPALIRFTHPTKAIFVKVYRS